LVLVSNDAAGLETTAKDLAEKNSWGKTKEEWSQCVKTIDFDYAKATDEAAVKNGITN